VIVVHGVRGGRGSVLGHLRDVVDEPHADSQCPTGALTERHRQSVILGLNFSPKLARAYFWRGRSPLLLPRYCRPQRRTWGLRWGWAIVGHYWPASALAGPGFQRDIVSTTRLYGMPISDILFLPQHVAISYMVLFSAYLELEHAQASPP
jgi:hypothetical protein